MQTKQSILESAATIAVFNAVKKPLKTTRDDANTARKFAILNVNAHWRNVLKPVIIVKDVAQAHI